MGNPRPGIIRKDRSGSRLRRRISGRLVRPPANKKRRHTMSAFASMEDVETLFRPLKNGETEKTTVLLEVVSDLLRQEAKRVGKDIDKMIETEELLENVVKSVTVDVVARALMTSTDSEPMTQMSQSALGYSVSGTFLVPGGGLFIKNSELSRLGLRRQKFGVIDFYGND